MPDQLVSSDPNWNTAASAAPPPVAPGSDRTRIDTNIVGVDHDRIVQGIANWASTLSPSLRKPAAMLATFPADALASLVEVFSGPEVVGPAARAPVAALAAGTGRTLAAAPGAAVRGAARGLAAAGDAVSPELVGVLSPRAGQALKVGQKVRDAMRAAPEATPAAAPPVTPAPARAPSAPSAAGKFQMGAAEFREYQRLLKVGKSPTEARALIEAQRDMVKRLGLPSAEEARRAAARRGDTGRWPEN